MDAHHEKAKKYQSNESEARPIRDCEGASLCFLLARFATLTPQAHLATVQSEQAFLLAGWLWKVAARRVDVELV